MTGPDSSAEIQSTPDIVRVANLGDYRRAVEGTSYFHKSFILPAAGDLVEAGDFKKALGDTRKYLEEDGIEVRPVPGIMVGPGTLIEEDGKQVIRTTENPKSEHPAYLLYELLHKRMSLLLTKAGKRGDPELIELLNMDKALAASIRLGAAKSEEDYEQTMWAAKLIENEANRKLARIAAGEPEDI